MIFDLIRAVAALAVLGGHAHVIFAAQPDPAQWAQQYGVVVFFLLSGFLISRTLHRRLADPQSTFLDYAIDRWSRIYSGYLPAILLIVVIDYVATSGTAGVFQETVERYTVPLFFANLFMLQAPAVTLPFGSAAPFWSVAIEFWIYMFVGLLAFTRRDGVSLFLIVAIGLAGIIPVQSLTDNNLVLMPWLLGAAAERLLATGWFDRIPRLLIGTAGVAALFYLTQKSKVYEFTSFFGAAVVFASLVILFERTTRFSAAAAWLASWSYSLYLLHHSILLLVAKEYNGHLRIYVAVVASIAVAIPFAMLTEAHHKQLAGDIKRRVTRISDIRERAAADVG